MKTLLMLSVCVVLSLQLALHQNERKIIPSDIDPMSDQMIDYINRLNTTWKVIDSFEN